MADEPSPTRWSFQVLMILLNTITVRVRSIAFLCPPTHPPSNFMNKIESSHDGTKVKIYLPGWSKLDCQWWKLWKWKFCINWAMIFLKSCCTRVTVSLCKFGYIWLKNVFETFELFCLITRRNKMVILEWKSTFFTSFMNACGFHPFSVK